MKTDAGFTAPGVARISETSNSWSRRALFSTRVLFVVVPLVIAAIAANVPPAWIYGQSAEERASQVLSEFINLGSDPPESPIKADWLVRNERLKLLREKRLVHVPPALITVYAEAAGITDAAFRARLIDPLRDDPFETAAARLLMPRDAPQGSIKGLSWAIATSEPVHPSRSAGSGCGRWLVYWDMQDWFYAPVGSKTLNERLLQAVPAFRDVPPGALSGCDADD